MYNLILSLQIVAPFCLFLLTGFILCTASFLNEQTRLNLNKLITNVGLPALLFVNTCRSDFRQFSDWKTILFASVGIVAVFLGALLVVPRLVDDRARCASIIHALFRGNTIIYGIPIVQGLLGDQADLSGIMAIITSSTVIYNLLGVTTLTTFCRRDKTSFLSVVLQLARTPMLIGALLGIALSLLGVMPPAPIMSFASGLSAMTTPLAFLCLGASFRLYSGPSSFRACLVAALVRLLVIPSVFLGLAILGFGFRGLSLACLISIFATPCAINTYPQASAFGADAEVAGGILIYTTAGSIFSIVLIGSLFKAWGLL